MNEQQTTSSYIQRFYKIVWIYLSVSRLWIIFNIVLIIDVETTVTTSYDVLN